MASRWELSAVLCRCLILAGTAAVWIRPAPAQTAITAWGLQGGDEFTVAVTIVKQTEVSIGGETSGISESRDQLLIQYRVARVLNNGDCIVTATVKSLGRETGDSSPASLRAASSAARTAEALRISFRLDADGKVVEISPADRDTALAQLSNLDQKMVRLFHRAASDEVIQAWLSKPFWISRHAGNAEESATWQREDFMAMGLFGTLRAGIELTADESDGPFSAVKLSGEGRFIPLVLPEVDEKGRLLKDVSIELDEYTGAARLFVRPAKAAEPDENPEGIRIQPRSQSRPPFESLTCTIRFHGTGILQSSPASAPQEVSFRQTQIQSWSLSEYAPGIPSLRFRFDVPARP